MHQHDHDAGREPISGPECQEALDTLYHYLDGELTPTKRQVIQSHLDRCSSCLEAFDFEAELKILIARRCRDTVPDGLRARIAEALTSATGSAPGPQPEPGRGPTTDSDR